MIEVFADIAALNTATAERIVAAAKQKGNGQTEEIWRLLDLMK